MRVAIIINILLLLFLSSCTKDKSIKRYYPEEEITYIATPINNSDSVFYAKWYYKNGNIEQEGMVINNLYEGQYKIYFEDGAFVVGNPEFIIDSGIEVE